MSTNVVGVKLHSSGWWGSKRNSAGGVIVAKALCTPAPAASAARAVDRGEGDRVIGVERVAVGVRDEHVGRELADRVGDPVERFGVDLQRVVAEVEAAEARAERPPPAASASLVADLLDVLDRLVLLLPQLAGLAALAVGQRDHLGRATRLDGLRDGAAGAPDEVGRMRADDLDAAQSDRPASACSSPPSCGPPPRRSRASSRRSAISASPSSTGGLKTWPRSVESTECSGPVARIAS